MPTKSKVMHGLIILIGWMFLIKNKLWKLWIQYKAKQLNKKVLWIQTKYKILLKIGISIKKYDNCNFYNQINFFRHNQ